MGALRICHSPDTGVESARYPDVPGALTYPTLEHVAMQARPYPTELLEDCETALVLFAAAFMGHNDAVHFAERGMQGTCVDIDGERLATMADLYPEGWSFYCDDAWAFAQRNTGKRKWDAVSADSFTGTVMERSLDSLGLWASLARKVVTATLTSGARYSVPSGWIDSLYERASGVYWLVLERA